MATYIITSSLSSPSDIFLSTTLSPVPSSQGEFVNTLRNMRTLAVYNFDSLPTYPLPFPNILQIGSPPYTLTLNSTIAFSAATYQDSVYKIDSEFDGGSQYYTSLSSYVLATTAIDAGIAALPTATPADVARKNYIVSLRAQVDTFFNAANYTSTIDYIVALETILFSITNNTINFTATLPLPTRVNLTGTNIMLTTLTGGWYNNLKNTLTNVDYSYTWNKNIDQVANYPDGVYENYSSVIVYHDAGFTKTARLNEATDYVLVTTFISEQISIFEENYNPNDPNQVSLLEALQENFALIQTYFDDEDYEGANDQIVIVETLLENVNVCAGLSMVLASGTTNQMVLTYPSLPSGTYSEQTGTLINSITGDEYTFTGFPANSSNTQLILNSNDIGAGSSFADGVWQVSNTFVNVATYQCTAYALVVTNARCCVRKAQAKSATCRNLTGRAEELSSWLETAIDEFNYSAYSVSNGFIKKINAVCSSCGCGC
jgi:hypothetical protein